MLPAWVGEDMDLLSCTVKTNFLASSRNQFPVNPFPVAIDSAVRAYLRGKSKGEGMDIDRVLEAEQQLVDRMAQARARGLSTPMRYALATGLIVGAVVVTELFWNLALHREPTTFVPLIVAVVASSRLLGVGPGWLSAALAAAILAWELSLDGNFDPQDHERFLGTVGAYVAILIFDADASWLRGLRARTRRSAAPRQPSTTEHHRPTQRQQIAARYPARQPL